MAEYTNAPKTPFSEDELVEFRNLILEKKDQAVQDVQRFRKDIENQQEIQGDENAYSSHMADAGTDSIEMEKTNLMIGRQQDLIDHLDRALERIANGTYGICKVTGKPISKERLKAVPHTQTSIEAKKQQR